MEDIQLKYNLYEYAMQRYSKVLSINFIKETIFNNNIDNARDILKQNYQEELEYNRRNKI